MLLSTLKGNPDVDVYVLAIVKNAVVYLKGWASKEDLIKKENMVDLGYGQGYGLDQDKLNELNSKYGFQ